MSTTPCYGGARYAPDTRGEIRWSVKRPVRGELTRGGGQIDWPRVKADPGGTDAATGGRFSKITNFSGRQKYKKKKKT